MAFIISLNFDVHEDDSDSLLEEVSGRLAGPARPVQTMHDVS